MYSIDIETIPNLEMIKYLPEVKADSRLKDENKIKEDIAKKQQEQIDKMALSPEFGKIACIGIYGEDRKEVLIGDEKEILQSLFNIFNIIIDKKSVVTFNGIGFDFDFIYKRAIFYGITKLCKMKQYTDKHNDFFHIDLMREYCKYGEYKSLDLLSKIYLGEGKIEFDFKEIPELLKTEEGKEKLKEYCLKDCELTYRLAKKFGY